MGNLIPQAPAESTCNRSVTHPCAVCGRRTLMMRASARVLKTMRTPSNRRPWAGRRSRWRLPRLSPDPTRLLVPVEFLLASGPLHPEFADGSTLGTTAQGRFPPFERGTLTGPEPTFLSLGLSRKRRRYYHPSARSPWEGLMRVSVTELGQRRAVIFALNKRGISPGLEPLR